MSASLTSLLGPWSRDLSPSSSLSDTAWHIPGDKKYLKDEILPDLLPGAPWKGYLLLAEVGCKASLNVSSCFFPGFSWRCSYIKVMGRLSCPSRSGLPETLLLHLYQPRSHNATGSITIPREGWLRLSLLIEDITENLLSSTRELRQESMWSPSVGTLLSHVRTYFQTLKLYPIFYPNTFPQSNIHMFAFSLK